MKRESKKIKKWESESFGSAELLISERKEGVGECVFLLRTLWQRSY